MARSHPYLNKFQFGSQDNTEMRKCKPKSESKSGVKESNMTLSLKFLILKFRYLRLNYKQLTRQLLPLRGKWKSTQRGENSQHFSKFTVENPPKLQGSKKNNKKITCGKSFTARDVYQRDNS